MQHILKLYTYEESNSLLDIYTKPTHNINCFYLHILRDENDTLINFLKFENITFLHSNRIFLLLAMILMLC